MSSKCMKKRTSWHDFWQHPNAKIQKNTKQGISKEGGKVSILIRI